MLQEVSELQGGLLKYIFINTSVSATAEAVTGCVASQDLHFVILGYFRVPDSHVINLKFPPGSRGSWGVTVFRFLMFSGGWKGAVPLSAWVR